MKHFFKGTAAVVIVLMVSMLIHVICNMKGISLEPMIISPVSAVSAVLIYQGLVSMENNNDTQETKK